MQGTKIWVRLLDVEKTVIEQVEAEEEESGGDDEVVHVVNGSVAEHGSGLE